MIASDAIILAAARLPGDLEWRYHHDAVFAASVKQMAGIIRAGQLSAADFREAALVAGVIATEQARQERMDEINAKAFRYYTGDQQPKEKQ